MMRDRRMRQRLSRLYREARQSVASLLVSKLKAEIAVVEFNFMLEKARGRGIWFGGDRRRGFKRGPLPVSRR